MLAIVGYNAWLALSVWLFRRDHS